MKQEKHSKVLKKALKLIESGSISYVCIAISDSCTEGVDHPLVYQIENAFKRDGVHGDGNVCFWLNKVHSVSFEQMTPERMKAYRIAWLKNWIKELEAKGE